MGVVAASASDSTAERIFELRWAKSLTAGALDSLREELRAEGKLKFFEQLQNFVTGGSILPSYDEASARMDIPRATVKTHVHRLRQRYREMVRREIGRGRPNVDRFLQEAGGCRLRRQGRRLQPHRYRCRY